MPAILSPNTEKTQRESGLIFKTALTLNQQGRVPEAIAAYRKMLEIHPEHAPSWANLGTLLRQQGHFSAALVCASRAIEISPGKASYLTNYGNCLGDLDRLQEAVAAHAAAVEDAPDEFLMRYNYAIALREAGDYAESLAQFDIACAMNPDNVNAQWDRALVYLHMGNYRDGWKAFEIRWKIGQIENHTSDKPQWTGQDLKGKTILVHAEQGFGDTILCARYIPLVKKRGGRVVLSCGKPLHRLFSALPGLDRTIEPGKMDEAYDYHVPMMSLPGIFDTTLESIPAVPKMLVPDAATPEAQRLLDLGRDRFKVGIVWSGSVTFKNNRRRATPMSRFLPLGEIPGVELYSLQKGPCERDIDTYGAAPLVHEIGPLDRDFADAAAVLNQLDLVIMTDSAIAHLSASVGCPVWNLLSYRPYWLYLTDREDTPWYDWMRLIRQPAPGDWDSVFDQAARDLKIAVEMKKAGKWPARVLKKPKQKKAS